MEEQLISFETAKLAKTLKFKLFVIAFYQKQKDNSGLLFVTQPSNLVYPLSYRDCNSGYQADWRSPKTCYSAPTQSLLQKWLREIHKLHIEVYNVKSTDYVWGWAIIRTDDPGKKETKDYLCYKTYEEALEVGLQQALNLLLKTK